MKMEKTKKEIKKLINEVIGIKSNLKEAAHDVISILIEIENETGQFKFQANNYNVDLGQGYEGIPCAGYSGFEKDIWQMDVWELQNFIKQSPEILKAAKNNLKESIDKLKS